MLVAVLIPVLLLIATMLMEKFETRLLDTRPRRRPVRGPLRLEAGPTPPVAQRHLQSVTEPAPLVLDAGPVEVVDQPLRRAS
ncbi:hypothetical protein LQ327_05945 [Actinomycetospora endophytica]|uniref:Secreted protein n=1 Tax=Actinomycetospora endophytica TaxID=2291215 RepID=A0ABS8P3U7_9PSEU|nr:hypothetical protein [Actinomycetospora endophytica]MCD2192930.1 hypothetical protein [Actinomycetospora endophytica]